jgi:hypothetical protein
VLYDSTVSATTDDLPLLQVLASTETQIDSDSDDEKKDFRVKELECLVLEDVTDK